MFRYNGVTPTEVAASAQHPLPQQRKLLSYSLRGQHTDKLNYHGGVQYQTKYELEPVAPETFWTFQQELALDGEKKGMLQIFDASGRMALGALSYINIESRDRNLLVQAFHTFPDDYAIVKIQTLFQLPE